MKKIEDDFSWGYYFCALRQFYGISQKEIAQEIGISAATLSKIEKGQRKMKEDKVKLVLNYFKKSYPDYCFDPSISKFEESDKILQEAFDDFFYRTYYSKINKYEDYLSDSSNRDSFGYFNYRLIEIYYLAFQHRETLKEIKQLIDLGCYLDDYHQALLYDLYGYAIDGKDKETTEKKLVYLYKARILAHSAGNGNRLEGLINYHIIRRYKDLSKPDKCLPMIEECKSLLQKENSYIRLLHFLATEGTIYQQLNLYSLASKVYIELLKNCRQVKSEQNLVRIAYDNLTWCEFAQTKYLSAVEYAQSALKNGSMFPDIFIVLSYGNLQIGKGNEALKYIKLYFQQERSTIREKIIGDFLILVKSCVESWKVKSNHVSEVLINQIIESLPIVRGIELELALYPMLSEHYTFFNQYKKGLYYEKLYSNYLRKEFCVH